MALRNSPPNPTVAAIELLNLGTLMELSSGIPEVAIGLIDGPVAASKTRRVRQIPPATAVSCQDPASPACTHGTFIADLLVCSDADDTPALSPGCTLLVRPIFSENSSTSAMPTPLAEPDTLATAIFDCIDAGAAVINLSLALTHPCVCSERRIESALDHARSRGVLIVAAAGNQGLTAGTPITQHAWVVPVAACDLRGRPWDYSNFGASIGSRGFIAPGRAAVSNTGDTRPAILNGTSVAAAFVTASIALLRSIFRARTAAQIRFALSQTAARRRTVVPPLFDARLAYECLAGGTL